MTLGATLIVVPVLRRPHRVAPLVASVRDNTPEAHRLLFVASPTDRAEIEAINAAGAEVLVMSADHRRGDYAKKINAAAAASTEPYVFTGADDLRFRAGWLTAALDKMADGAGVVGTNDLGSPRVIAGEHSTHSLVARWYIDLGTIDEPGKIFHEGYWHEFVDDELVETAKRRGAYAHADDSHVEHLHPAWGKAQRDALHAQFAQRMAFGRRVYNRRRHLWT